MASTSPKSLRDFGEVEAILETLPKETELNMEAAVNAYAGEMMRLGFLAGLKVGRDPLAWLVEG